MLAVSRAEVVSFLEELNQPYRHDSSNANIDLTRNRIRHELLRNTERGGERRMQNLDGDSTIVLVLARQIDGRRATPSELPLDRVAGDAELPAGRRRRMRATKATSRPPAPIRGFGRKSISLI